MSDLSLFDAINGYSKPKSREEGKKFISKSISGSFAGRQSNKGLKAMALITNRLKPYSAAL